MMDNTLFQQAVIAAIFAGLGSLATKLFDYLKQRQQLASEQTVAGYILTINRLDNRITTLEKELTLAREEHKECLNMREELRAEISILRNRLNTYLPPAHTNQDHPDAK